MSKKKQKMTTITLLGKKIKVNESMVKNFEKYALSEKGTITAKEALKRAKKRWGRKP